MSHRAMTGGVGAFEPCQGHAELRRLVRQFAEEEVDPQALDPAQDPALLRFFPVRGRFAACCLLS